MRSTEQDSTPGRFRTAREGHCPRRRTRGPRRSVYLLLRYLPLPARIFLDSVTLLSSSSHPSFFKSSNAALVFETDSAPSETTSGNSGTSSIRCPRAMTSGGRVLAASAEATAWRFCVTLTRRCHRRQTFVGLNIPPPRHMLPKAAWPERWVPPPGTRGMRATARPVPHDSAAVL